MHTFELCYKPVYMSWRRSLRAQAAHVAQAGGVAVVVGNDDGGVERLEVQHQHTAAVEARLGLHDQRDALRRPLLGALLHAGCHRNVVQRLGQAQHHRLHPVLEGEEPQATNHSQPRALKRPSCDTLIGLHCKRLTRLLPGSAASRSSKQSTGRPAFCPLTPNICISFS